MTALTTAQLDEIDRKAKAASEPSGRWKVYRCQWADDGEACAIEDDGGNRFCQDGSRDECHHLIPRSDAEHIAANSPDVTLRLVAIARAALAYRDDCSPDNWRALYAALDGTQ